MLVPILVTFCDKDGKNSLFVKRRRPALRVHTGMLPLNQLLKRRRCLRACEVAMRAFLHILLHKISATPIPLYPVRINGH